MPPTSGSKAGVGQAVEVIIHRRVQPALVGFFVKGPVDLAGRAVASVQSTGGSFCVLALEVTAQSTVVNGASSINLPNCGLAVNSANAQAVLVTGSASITATHVSIVGGYRTTGVARVTTTVAPAPATGQAPLADPYADLPLPSYGGCTYTNFHLASNTKATLYPGVYCNGLRVTDAAEATLMPGTYIIDRGTFTVAGSAKFKALGGVTFIMTSSTGSNYPSIYQEGATTMYIEAPTSGPYAGIAIFQDRRAPASGNNRFTGSTNQAITGAIYIPSQTVTWEGTAGSGNPAQCTQIVARALTINGSATLRNNCAGTGVRDIARSKPALFE